MSWKQNEARLVAIFHVGKENKHNGQNNEMFLSFACHMIDQVSHACDQSIIDCL